MTKETTIDSREVAKFSQLATTWWDKNGALKTLHDINPTRIGYIQQFATLQGERILDVGCGGGILSEGLAQAGAQITGLDAEQHAIAVAAAHAKQAELTIDYHCQPIETYEAPLFDHVVCMEMLEHVNDPQLVIAHCTRLLKPGGFLFLSTLNRTLTAYATAVIAAEYLLKLLPRQTHDYQKFITPSELARLTRATGLELVNLSGLSYNPLARTASLNPNVAINYLMVCKKAD